MNPVLFPPYHKCNSFLDFLLFSHCVLLNEMKIGFLFQKKERINSLSLRSLYSFFSFPRLGLRWNEERIEDISTSSYFNISINIYLDKKNCLCCWNLLLSSYSINIQICFIIFILSHQFLRQVIKLPYPFNHII